MHTIESTKGRRFARVPAKARASPSAQTIADTDGFCCDGGVGVDAFGQRHSPCLSNRTQGCRQLQSHHDYPVRRLAAQRELRGQTPVNTTVVDSAVLNAATRSCHTPRAHFRSPCFTRLPRLDSIRYAGIKIPVSRAQRRIVPDRRTRGVEVPRPDRADLQGRVRREPACNLKERM